jgi:uncharacterized protein (TIGR04255 family)
VGSHSVDFDRTKCPRQFRYNARVAAPRQLRTPPIIEALIDFRVLLSAPISKDSLRPLIEEVRQEFPEVHEQQHFEAAFRVEDGRMVPPEAREIFQGVRLTKNDGNRQVQFRTDGFTFNNVGQYIGGDALIAEALALWPRYVAVARPDKVTRLAMRYINRLMDLPWRQGDPFGRFLGAAAELPEPGPQAVTEFLSRTVAHDARGPTAIVTQNFGPGPDPQHPFQITLDVDVFVQELLPTEPAELRPKLDTLRDVKNRAFFSLLTEEAVKLYE